MTKKQLIVVVHGVGINEAGVCSRALAANLSSNQDAAKPSSLPVSNETFYVGEEWQSEPTDLKTTFPVTATHYKTQKTERVIADFYWGDISSIGGNVASLIIAFITTILGLAHPLRENTRKVYGDKHWMRTLVDLFIKTVHGPIAASTIMIFAGLITFWGWQKIWGSTLPAVLPIFTIIGIFSLFGYGLAFAKSSTPLIGRFKQKSYLGQHLGKWLILFSVILLAIFVVQSFRSEDHAPNLAKLFCKIANTAEKELGEKCIHKFSGAYVHGAQLILVTQLFWFFAAVLLSTIIISDLIISKNEREANLVSANASALFFLWLLSTGFALGAVAYSGVEILPSRLWARSSFMTLPVVVLMLLALIAIAMITVSKKRLWVTKFSVQGTKEFAPNSPQILDYGRDNIRTIVHPWVRKMLTVTGSIIVMFMFIQCADFVIRFFEKSNQHSQFASINFEGGLSLFSIGLSQLFPYALLLVGLASTLLFTLAREQIRAGLEIFLDVITYLNDYTFGQKNTEANYPLKDRIEARLTQSINLLLARDKFDELVIVSHSQGTVFAINTLKERSGAWRRKLNNKGKVKLITMGSPFAHIYEHYFPERVVKNLIKESDADLDDWVNIFRIDDFVGTYVDPQGNWPREVAVSKNGHTNYWVDKNVAAVIRALVD